MPERPSHEHYDLIIIGGGINGAACARDAAMRGMSVLLFEADDYAAGASSRTSKLAHGGIRYLESYDFRLVKEALTERNILLRTAPHLVKPLPFVFPVYQGAKRPLWMVRLGMYLYDWFDRDSPVPHHDNIGRKEILSSFPDLREDGLRGGGRYYDAQMMDHRLVIEALLQAQEYGGECFNHTKVVELIREGDSVCGVRYKSELLGIEGEARATVVLNTTGPWNNQTTALDEAPTPCRVRTTKGVHLVLPHLPINEALILSHPRDKRIFFILPWRGDTLVGTTDTDYAGDPGSVRVEQTDRDYLMEAVRHYFPDIPLSDNDIIAAFAGLRPLAGEVEGHPSAASREHQIGSSESGLISMVGGKYTTARAVAEEIIDKVAERLPRPIGGCITADAPYFGGRPSSVDLYPAQLTARYGSAAGQVAEYIDKDPEQAKPICPLHTHLHAELSFAIEREQARTLEDWFYRRTYIAYSPCRGRNCVEIVAKRFAELLGWAEDQTQEAIDRYVHTLT